MAILKRKVAMSLMAHPDDCEFLAIGTLTLLRENGWEVHIVTMTPGDCGSPDLGPEEIAAKRRKEAAAAAAIIGASYHCLESRDIYVAMDEPTLRRAVSLTRSIAPTLVFTHSLDCYMMDHEVTARIARSVTFSYAMPNACSGPIPKGAGVPYLYYADAIEGINVYGQPVEPTVFTDVSGVMKTKTKMLHCHASQRDWLRAHHGLDEYTRSMKDWCRRRGQQVGFKYAEGFRQHKGHGYPQPCVLAKELGRLVTRSNPA